MSAVVAERDAERALPGSALAVRVRMKHRGQSCLLIRWAESALVLADGRRLAVMPPVAVESVADDVAAESATEQSISAAPDIRTADVATVDGGVGRRLAGFAIDVFGPAILIAVVATSPLWIPIASAIGKRRQADDRDVRGIGLAPPGDLVVCRGDTVAAVVSFAGREGDATVTPAPMLELHIITERTWLARVPVEPARR